MVLWVRTWCFSLSQTLGQNGLVVSVIQSRVFIAGIHFCCMRSQANCNGTSTNRCKIVYSGESCSIFLAIGKYNYLKLFVFGFTSHSITLKGKILSECMQIKFPLFDMLSNAVCITLKQSVNVFERCILYMYICFYNMFVFGALRPTQQFFTHSM